MSQGINQNCEYIEVQTHGQSTDEETATNQINGNHNSSNDILVKIAELKNCGDHRSVYEFFEELSASRNREMMKKACEEGLWKKKSCDTSNILHLACRNGIIHLVKSLIFCGCDKESRTKFGLTPLIIASCYGHLDVVKFLISIGADIEAKNKYGYTPLIFAAGNGHLEVVHYLVSVGANKEAKNNDEYTPLKCASIKGRHKVVKYLVAQGADKSVMNNEGKTVFSVAIDSVRNYLGFFGFK
ncbi:hypothetical protein TVAG_004010 [Trichomonas vaginalis G3]|uniref:Uncharacterized protein n=1 Tax=Trichomonas vaginalis (strain ATCC PRA-98 / G3) TaxID=412133 RepID=A2E5B5_TRIV3|nr:positive regulation of MDA-5 signaling pathway [Trichomonas vaginalis G3]EAY12195.1 hypothetical protein TVAG_004010 [Trichomonas vaginalis G3]KAI5515405.1 positive regulation of MDA-5 signaling pathway [Trichomonas vaginalis G3]|eukprot:XP_001324418.1 hypothetical protein [Trichomonas vaginalis G3]